MRIDEDGGLVHMQQQFPDDSEQDDEQRTEPLYGYPDREGLSYSRARSYEESEHITESERNHKLRAQIKHQTVAADVDAEDLQRERNEWDCTQRVGSYSLGISNNSERVARCLSDFPTGDYTWDDADPVKPRLGRVVRPNPTAGQTFDEIPRGKKRIPSPSAFNSGNVLNYSLPNRRGDEWKGLVERRYINWKTTASTVPLAEDPCMGMVDEPHCGNTAVGLCHQSTFHIADSHTVDIKRQKGLAEYSQHNQQTMESAISAVPQAHACMGDSYSNDTDRRLWYGKPSDNDELNQTRPHFSGSVDPDPYVEDYRTVKYPKPGRNDFTRPMRSCPEFSPLGPDTDEEEEETFNEDYEKEEGRKDQLPELPSTHAPQEDRKPPLGHSPASQITPPQPMPPPTPREELIDEDTKSPIETHSKFKQPSKQFVRHRSGLNACPSEGLDAGKHVDREEILDVGDSNEELDLHVFRSIPPQDLFDPDRRLYEKGLDLTGMSVNDAKAAYKAFMKTHVSPRDLLCPAGESLSEHMNTTHPANMNDINFYEARFLDDSEAAKALRRQLNEQPHTAFTRRHSGHLASERALRVGADGTIHEGAAKEARVIHAKSKLYPSHTDNGHDQYLVNHLGDSKETFSALARDAPEHRRPFIPIDEADRRQQHESLEEGEIVESVAPQEDMQSNTGEYLKKGSGHLSSEPVHAERGQESEKRRDPAYVNETDWVSNNTGDVKHTFAALAKSNLHGDRRPGGRINNNWGLKSGSGQDPMGTLDLEHDGQNGKRTPPNSEVKHDQDLGRLVNEGGPPTPIDGPTAQRRLHDPNDPVRPLQ